VGLQGCGDFVGRLQRVVDGPIPCSVVTHGAQYRASARFRSPGNSLARRPPVIRRIIGAGRRLSAVTRK
jgi:hypothetical protein